MSSVVFGVAIATALMPPLCTVGFGLAKQNFEIWGGALYLFFINAVIISATTYAFVRFLQFPPKKYFDPREKAKANLFIGVFVILMTIPSFFILRQTLEKLNTDRQVSAFIKDKINNNNREALDTRFIKNDSTNVLKIYMVGEGVRSDSIPNLEKFMHENYTNLSGTTLKLVQTQVSQDEKDRLISEVADERGRIVLEVTKQIQEQKERLEELANLQNKITQLKIDSVQFQVIKKEVEAMYPESRVDYSIYKLLTNKSIDTNYVTPPKIETSDSLKIDSLVTNRVKADSLVMKIDTTLKMTRMPIIFIHWDSLTADGTMKKYEQRISDYMKARFDYDTLKIVRE